jgi:hypothetical protein
MGEAGTRFYGMWFGGQNYKGSGYYGAFPAGFLKRITSLFTDCEEVLHLFSGSIPLGDYDRVDMNPANGAEYTCIAHELSDFLPKNHYDVIYADPPYTDEDSNKYGTPSCNRNKVVKECNKILKPGGFLVWLDQVLPMFRKDELEMVGSIGYVRSTNHRFRVVTVFRKH